MVPVSRRAFGQTLGLAAVAGTLAERGADAAPAQSAVRKPNRADELCDLSAIDLAALIRRKEVSAREVMAAHLARIERVNPKVNAIVTLVADRALADAARADEPAVRGGPLGG